MRPTITRSLWSYRLCRYGGIWSRTNLTGYEPAISENLWLLSAVNVAHIQNTSVGSATITSLLYSTNTVYVNEVCLPNSRPLLPLLTRIILILELFVSIFGFKANLPKTHIQQLHLWIWRTIHFESLSTFLKSNTILNIKFS